MPLDRLNAALTRHVATLEENGTAKGDETVVVEVIPPSGERGPRFRLEGEGEREFIRMNSNSYLGLSLVPAIMAAEEEATAHWGAGPGAVRFISGTYAPHIALEQRLAAFHGREAAMIFSSAYATVLSTIVPLTDERTVLISDELNHNCIINAMRLARPAHKAVYKHNDVRDLERALEESSGKGERAIVVTDGIFSMRGDHAPLHEILSIAHRHDAKFPENVVVIVDDSHGVGASGPTGRGTEEHLASGPADLLVGTLGKAFGVNGGYVTGPRILIDLLRETAPMYIYSNPITPAEAAAASRSVELLDSPEGATRLGHLREVTHRFRDGLVAQGLETLPGSHPVVPLFVRDTARTTALVRHLREHGILATGLNYPVVPKGDETIRFQLSADHTAADVDFVLATLKSFVAAPTGA